MEQATHSVLAGWETFYVIVGTAVAALIGLQFVATVLTADMHIRADEVHRTFATPTIVHFCTVLLIAASLTAPWPALWGVALIVGACGVAGVIFMAVIIRIVRRQTVYKPVLEDWICHFTLPPIAYAILLVTALILQNHPVLSLFGINGAILVLLFVGIHNAWDSVTFTALNLQQRSDEQGDQK